MKAVTVNEENLQNAVYTIEHISGKEDTRVGKPIMRKCDVHAARMYKLPDNAARGHASISVKYSATTSR